MGTQVSFDPTEQYRKLSREWFKGQNPALPHIPRDWADDLIKGAAAWIHESDVPEWLQRKIANVPNVLLQLPAPDHRWILKFRGGFWDPFDFRFSGWHDAHDLISQRTQSLIGTINIEQTGMAGNATLSGSGKSCADACSEAVRKRIERWLKMLSRRMPARIAKEFSNLFVLKNGRYSFCDPGQPPWMTVVGEIPFDATMILDRGRWIFEVPFSNHELILPDDANLKYLARILMSGNFPVPAALLVDGFLLKEFQSRPPYRGYFRRTFRPHKIHAGTDEGGEIGQAICRVMHLKEGQCFTASDEIAVDSVLHKVCDVPLGPVTLLPNGIRGVQAVVAKQHFLKGVVGPQFHEIEQYLSAGLKWVLRYPNLLEQIETVSQQARPTVSMGLKRLREKLIKMPKHWTTPYDELARHIKEHVYTGKVFRYTGSLHWKVEGLEPLPDPVELAIDHLAFKRRAAYKQRMRERRDAELVPTYVKPKPEIYQPDKWDASVRAELAKMQEQPNWLRVNADTAAHDLRISEKCGGSSQMLRCNTFVKQLKN